MLFLNNPIGYALLMATSADICHVFMNENNILYDFAKPAFIME